MKLSKIFQASFFSCLLFNNLFCAQQTSFAEMFEGILFSIQQECKEKSPKSIDNDFENLTSIASNQFQELYKKFKVGYSFIKYAYVQQSFSELCRNIKKVDKRILKSEKLRAGDLNLLMKSVRKFKDAVYSELRDSDESDEKYLENLYTEVESFFKITNKIYKKSYSIIGSFSARTWEFIKDYWKIGAGIAGVAAGAKVVYDMRHYWDRYKDSKDSSLYRNALRALFCVGVGSFVGAGDYFDGCVGYQEGPVARDEDTKEKFSKKEGRGEIRFFENQYNQGRTWRDDKNITLVGITKQEQFDFNCHVVTVPCVIQSGGTCGYHALFNASNMFGENYDALKDRQKCIGKVDKWRGVVGHNAWIHKEDMEKIIANDDSDLKQSILDENNQLKENVSIIELPSVINQLNALNKKTYEVEYNENQHENLYSGKNVECIKRKYENSKKEEQVRVEYFFSGKPSNLLPEIGDGMSVEYMGGIDENIVINIDNFRNYEKPQIIILNTGNHWIAIRLEVKNGKDHITVADSMGSGYEGGYRSAIQKLYYLFKYAPLGGNEETFEDGYGLKTLFGNSE